MTTPQNPAVARAVERLSTAKRARWETRVDELVENGMARDRAEHYALTIEIELGEAEAMFAPRDDDGSDASNS